jgi:uncharacterized protein (DUF427 family)
MIVVEGNYCFPLEISIRIIVLKQLTIAVVCCQWKVEASYYVIKVNDEISENASREIISYVAFLKNVTIKK